MNTPNTMNSQPNYMKDACFRSMGTKGSKQASTNNCIQFAKNLKKYWKAFLLFLIIFALILFQKRNFLSEGIILISIFAFNQTYFLIFKKAHFILWYKIIFIAGEICITIYLGFLFSNEEILIFLLFLIIISGFKLGMNFGFFYLLFHLYQLLIPSFLKSDLNHLLKVRLFGIVSSLMIILAQLFLKNILTLITKMQKRNEMIIYILSSIQAKAITLIYKNKVLFSSKKNITINQMMLTNVKNIGFKFKIYGEGIPLAHISKETENNKLNHTDSSNNNELKHCCDMRKSKNFLHQKSIFNHNSYIAINDIQHNLAKESASKDFEFINQFLEEFLHQNIGCNYENISENILKAEQISKPNFNLNIRRALLYLDQINLKLSNINENTFLLSEFIINFINYYIAQSNKQNIKIELFFSHEITEPISFSSYILETLLLFEFDLIILWIGSQNIVITLNVIEIKPREYIISLAFSGIPVDKCLSSEIDRYYNFFDSTEQFSHQELGETLSPNVQTLIKTKIWLKEKFNLYSQINKKGEENLTIKSTICFKRETEYLEKFYCLQEKKFRYISSISHCIWNPDSEFIILKRFLPSKADMNKNTMSFRKSDIEPFYKVRDPTIFNPIKQKYENNEVKSVDNNSENRFCKEIRKDQNIHQINEICVINNKTSANKFKQDIFDWKRGNIIGKALLNNILKRRPISVLSEPELNKKAIIFPVSQKKNIVNPLCQNQIFKAISSFRSEGLNQDKNFFENENLSDENKENNDIKIVKLFPVVQATKGLTFFTKHSETKFFHKKNFSTNDQQIVHFIKNPLRELNSWSPVKKNSIFSPSKISYSTFLSSSIFEIGLNNVKFFRREENRPMFRYVITSNKVALLGFEDTLIEKLIEALTKLRLSSEILIDEIELTQKLELNPKYYQSFFLLIMKSKNKEKCELLFKKFAELEKQNYLHKPIICLISENIDPTNFPQIVKDRVEIVIKDPLSSDILTKLIEIIH